MLTFSCGHAGPAWTGLPMAAHLSRPTLTSAMELEAARHGLEPVATAQRTVALAPGDLHPRLGRLLGITGPPSLRELAALLAGRTARGLPIPGAIQRRASKNLATRLGLSVERLPDAAELAEVALAGRRGSAGARQLLAHYGVAHDCDPDDADLERMAAGGRLDGGPVRGRRLLEALASAPSRIAYIDLTLAADKSVSVAWAGANGAERAIIAAAHHEAADETVRRIVETIGAVRRGDGGRFGREAGSCAWFAFRHYTARPTRIADPNLPAGIVRPGAPHLHIHHILLNAVLTDDDRIGSLDTGALRGRVWEFGAQYQASLARHLRAAGVDVAYDRRRCCARVAGIGDATLELFSQRTATGRRGAQRWAEAHGLDLASMGGPARVALLKASVQDPRGARGDDVADEAAWRSWLAEAGAVASPVVDVYIAPLCDRSDRLRRAATLALAVRAEAAAAGLPVTDRTAATRALVAEGFEGERDVDEVVAILEPQASPAGPGLEPARGGASRAPDRALRGERRLEQAILVDGSRTGYHDELARLWCERWGHGDLARPELVGCPDHVEAGLVAAAVRRRRRDAGEMGLQDAVEVDGVDGRLPLAIGDLMALAAPVNAARAGERPGRARNGRIGVAGTLLRIRAVDEEGLDVENQRGDRARVRWESLWDETGYHRIRTGYATTVSDGRATMVSHLRGSTPTAPAQDASSRLLCFSLQAEAAACGAAESDTRRIWEAIEERSRSGERERGCRSAQPRSIKQRVRALGRMVALRAERNGGWAAPWLAALRWSSLAAATDLLTSCVATFAAAGEAPRSDRGGTVATVDGVVSHRPVAGAADPNRPEPLHRPAPSAPRLEERDHDARLDGMRRMATVVKGIRDDLRAAAARGATAAPWLSTARQSALGRVATGLARLLGTVIEQRNGEQPQHGSRRAARHGPLVPPETRPHPSQEWKDFPGAEFSGAEPIAAHDAQAATPKKPLRDPGPAAAPDLATRVGPSLNAVGGRARAATAIATTPGATEPTFVQDRRQTNGPNGKEGTRPPGGVAPSVDPLVGHVPDLPPTVQRGTRGDVPRRKREPSDQAATTRAEPARGEPRAKTTDPGVPAAVSAPNAPKPSFGKRKKRKRPAVRRGAPEL